MAAHVVFVAPDSEATVREMVGPTVSADRILANVPLGSMGIAGTPTLMLVKPTGVVSEAWAGELPRDSDAAIREEIKRVRGST
jgi:hypothetical protein